MTNLLGLFFCRLSTSSTGVCSANLTSSKIKDILKYPCCHGQFLWEMGLNALTKHCAFYFGLPLSERTILLRGCLKSSHTGRTGYEVEGNAFCRTGFKKLFSVGNNRLQRVSHGMFSRFQKDVFRKEKSGNHLSLVEWLKDFFKTNVESLPNKDIFHLPDNWTKLEVFDAFQNDSKMRKETSVTYSYFCRIWEKEFPRVRIPKRSRFSTCAPCTEFKALRDKATLETERSEFICQVCLCC